MHKGYPGTYWIKLACAHLKSKAKESTGSSRDVELDEGTTRAVKYVEATMKDATPTIAPATSREEWLSNLPYACKVLCEGGMLQDNYPGKIDNTLCDPLC